MNNFRQARNSLTCPFHNYRYVWQCHYDQAHYLHTIDKLIEYLFPLFFFFLCLSFLLILSQNLLLLLFGEDKPTKK